MIAGYTEWLGASHTSTLRAKCNLGCLESLEGHYDAALSLLAGYDARAEPNLTVLVPYFLPYAPGRPALYHTVASPATPARCVPPARGVPCAAATLQVRLPGVGPIASWQLLFVFCVCRIQA